MAPCAPLAAAPEAAVVSAAGMFAEPALQRAYNEEWAPLDPAPRAFAALDCPAGAAHDFIGLTQATALQMHIAKHAARLGLRLQVRARLRDFDAICRMVAAGLNLDPAGGGTGLRCDPRYNLPV